MNIFLSKNEEYKIFTKELIDFLGDDLFTSPASTSTFLYNAYPGGLIDFVLKITKYAVKINELLPDNKKVDHLSLIKVCLLHQIGKVKLYTLINDEWKNKKGIMYDYNKDLVSMKIGERSVYYAINNGVTLTDIEYITIINHDKENNDPNIKWFNTPMGTILRQAIELATIEVKDN